MRILEGVSTGDQVVGDDTRLEGVVLGDMKVVAGGSLVLDGVCWGSLDIDPGGEAHLEGFVKGNVSNHGGRLQITGVIWGDLREHAGDTVVEPGAIVRKRTGLSK